MDALRSIGFKKSFTFTLTISGHDLTVLAIFLFHMIIGFYTLSADSISSNGNKQFAQNDEAVTQKEEVIIPVKLRWVISKKARASRFGKYVESMKDKDFSSEVAESKYGEEEIDQGTLDEIKELGLSKSQMQKIAKENKVKYEENVKLLRDLLQKNQKSYQACYEKALLKDDLMSGVSGLVLTVHNGRLSAVDTVFKGDGHKSAVKALDECLVQRSHKINLKQIAGSHKIKFNLVFKS